MTNLQIAYQQLLETQRANRASEGLKAQQVAVSAYEAATKAKETEAKLPLYQAQIGDALASANLKGSQAERIAYEIPKLLAETSLTKNQGRKVIEEISKLMTDTDYTEVQIAKSLQEVSNLVTQRQKTEAEIGKIEADTKLSKAQRVKAVNESLKSFIDMTTTGFNTIMKNLKIDPDIAKAILGEIAFD